MARDTFESLQQQSELLDTLYDQNLKAVRQLQVTLEHEILPGLIDEEGWNENEVEHAIEWLQDTPSVFRMLKRHKFTASLALEALRTTLVWRLQTLPPLSSKPPVQHITCLPTHAHDPLGRPIVVIQAAKLLSSTDHLRELSAHTSELMRMHLVQLNKTRQNRAESARPILQYVALLDIGDMSLNSMQTIDWVNWHLQELLPRFPGMLAAVFILSYSWTHSGLWNLAKRILPDSMLHKIFFCSISELRQLLSPGMLPTDYGGDLPPIAEIHSPLEHYVAIPPASISPSAHLNVDSLPSEVGPEPARPEAAAPIRTVLSSMSLLNPFYGYPAVYDDAAAPLLRHGRRRKRDLVATLARLWWARWGRRTMLLLTLIVLLLVGRRTRWWRAAQLQLPMALRRPVALPVRAFLPAVVP